MLPPFTRSKGEKGKGRKLSPYNTMKKKIFIVASVLMMSMMAVPVTMAATIPQELVPAWNELITTMRVKILGVANQLSFDKRALAEIGTQLSLVRTQLNIINSYPVNSTTRTSVLANAEVVVQNATARIAEISTRWEGTSNTLDAVIDALNKIVNDIIELSA